MFTLPHNTIAYLYKEAIDMRLGMFRLQGVIAQQLSQPMAKGCFFLFINKPYTLLKAVWFDGTGLCLFCKRLEQGQFSWPQSKLAPFFRHLGSQFNPPLLCACGV